MIRYQEKKENIELSESLRKILFLYFVKHSFELITWRAIKYVYVYENNFILQFNLIAFRDIFISYFYHFNNIAHRNILITGNFCFKKIKIYSVVQSTVRKHHFQSIFSWGK